MALTFLKSKSDLTLVPGGLTQTPVDQRVVQMWKEFEI